MQNERQKSNHPLIFDDVVIRLSQQMHNNEPSTFQAEIRQTPIPLEGGSFRIDSDEQLKVFHHLFTGQVNLNHFFYDYSTPPNESDPSLEQTADDLAELRDKLYELLPVSVRDELPRLIQKVFENGRGVRLIIEASAGDQADHLLSLPWELLFFKETRVYPARSRRLLIVRRLLDAVRHSSVEMTAPFDLVHVIADDREQPIEADLQEMERKAIPEAISPGTCVSIEKSGSVEKLLAALDKQPAQILHFLGHGEAPSEEKSSFATRGYLCFVNEAGKRQWVTGERLQHLLSGTPGLQLIVLNACDSASVVTSNIALDLVYSGFPYVVAMQAKMPQEAAKHFIRAFYSQLQEAQSIEYAVAAGRCEIATQLPGAIDWCLPVLYTNVGLAKKSPLVQSAEYVGQWVQRVNNLLPVTLVLGTLHMVVGLLLWFSGQSPPLPDLELIMYATGWVVVLPPFLAAWIYGFAQLPIPSDWPSLGEFYTIFLQNDSSSTNEKALNAISEPILPSLRSHARRMRLKFRPFQKPLILLSRLLGTAAFALGTLTFTVVWFSLVLFVGLGIWGSLSVTAQVLLLIPLHIIAIWLSYMLTHRSGLKSITSVQIAQEIPWLERIGPPFGGYAALLISLYLCYDSPDLFTPPDGNLFIGALLLVGSYLMHHFRDELENQPEGPWNI